MTMTQPVGDLLRTWRQRRRLSQLDLALEAEISARHLSFLETGRAQPSREMLLQLADRLEVPLRDRNILLVAAGYAPVFPERPLSDPALAAARKVIDTILTGHEPHPALAVDRHWTILAHNRAILPLLEGIGEALLRPPINALRLALHPDGLAPRITNFSEWRAHLLSRLHRELELSADPNLAALFEELAAYPKPDTIQQRGTTSREPGIAVPLHLATRHGPLAFVSTTTVFGTPIDITLAELALETFFPADEATAATMRRLVDSMQEGPAGASASG
ncbi:MAG TPA: helix-turn-helix transcriptional regulator [Geminicoccus sp.]|jgi:transcriptional regulator with XRE-family HTH domain|uniref:helix-turn-helix domain-containing protein n=1 Tax=Geminicoccus sp. TaxID=2024832 RepID=UPI002E2F6A42|nr:helix-turn-helix transcriptional regulator [Geminicoccus sp.]HEX2528325.1 helix-turn-helix transcriptional regulator [Geminicoccus sp.]